MNASELFLAADVGGTHTRLSLYECEADLFNPAWHKSYKISGPESFISTLSHFFDDIDQKPQIVCRAVISVAGPVSKGMARMTNQDRVIKISEIQNYLECSDVNLVNDLEAWAHSLPHLRKEDLHVLNQGVDDPEGIKACIAPGTGLGESVLIRHRPKTLPL